MRHCLCILIACVGWASARAQEPATALPLPGVPAAPFTSVPVEPTIRNITRPHNSMSQPLVGIGVVTGLAGTGSSDRATRQALINLIRREKLNVSISDVTSGATALVSVTAQLPAFAKVGRPLDVKVENLGDAVSLRGGELLRCELRAVDGQVYVLAQGALLVGGYAVQGNNAQVQKNHVTTAWVTGGGQVVRDLESSFFSASGHLELQVLNPSPHNSLAIANGMRSALQGLGLEVTAVDPTLVRIELPPDQRTNENAMRILGLVRDVRVRVENPAKVIIDQATGTVLAGEGILISPCAVVVSDITIAVVNEDEISQPGPGLNLGTSERVGRTRIEVTTNESQPQPLAGGATIGDLLQNLRTLGLSASQLVSVFQALSQGQFLHAELEIR